jgi:hypothetical protein
MIFYFFYRIYHKSGSGYKTDDDHEPWEIGDEIRVRAIKDPDKANTFTVYFYKNDEQVYLHPPPHAISTES